MKRIYEYEDLQPVIDKLLQDKESGEIEFKSAAGGFPKSFWETYSSFANTDGGAIIFGIKEKDDQFFLDGLTEEQLLTLALAYSEEEITNERLQYALNMHKADITTMLAKMCSAHLLEPSGRGRGTKYHVYGLKVGLPDANVGLKVGLPDANIGLNVGLPEANVGLNIGLQKKRYPKEEMRKLIVDYCCDWRTVEEIAFFVNKKVRYIRDKVLPQMSDVIEKMYDIPHHPKQKYRTKQKDTEA